GRASPTPIGKASGNGCARAPTRRPGGVGAADRPGDVARARSSQARQLSTNGEHVADDAAAKPERDRDVLEPDHGPTAGDLAQPRRPDARNGREHRRRALLRRPHEAGTTRPTAEYVPDCPGLLQGRQADLAP